MNTPPSSVESSAPRFRTPVSAETGPTLRLTNIRQKLDQRARGQRTTRRTVDLAPTPHRALDIWQREAADRLGLTRVTGQEVLIALIDQLLTDPKLSAQVMRSIHDRR